MIQEQFRALIQNKGLTGIASCLHDMVALGGCFVFGQNMTLEFLLEHAYGSSSGICEAEKHLMAASKLLDKVIKQEKKMNSYQYMAFTDMMVIYPIYEEGFELLADILTHVFDENCFHYSEKQMEEIRKAIKHLMLIEEDNL